MGYTGKLQFRLPCSASISNASPSMQDLHMTFFQNLHCFDHPRLWRARDKDNCMLGELHKGQTLPFSVTSSFNSWQQTQYVLRGLSRDFSQTCSLGCAFPSISSLNILCCIRALMSVAPSFLLSSAQSLPLAGKLHAGYFHAGYSQDHKHSLPPLALLASIALSTSMR